MITASMVLNRRATRGWLRARQACGQDILMRVAWSPFDLLTQHLLSGIGWFYGLVLRMESRTLTDKLNYTLALRCFQW